MKNKSFQFKNAMNALATGKPSIPWGGVLFESYFKYDKKGNLIESTPRLDEWLNGLFYPFQPRLNGFKIYIEEIFTGLIVEQEQKADYFIERVTRKPDLTVESSKASRACRENFKRRFGIEYPGND